MRPPAGLCLLFAMIVFMLAFCVVFAINRRIFKTLILYNKVILGFARRVVRASKKAHDVGLDELSAAYWRCGW